MYLSTHPVNIIRVFSISDFLEKSLKVNKKLEENITYLIIQARSKNVSHFTHLNSLDIEKYILPQHRQKPFSLYKFFSKHLIGVRKNIDTAPFLDVQEAL